jgi:thioredoxin reductase
MTSSAPPALTPDVLIVGGGPAGLTAARALAPKVSGQVLVVDRESEVGGIPRHSNHLGYGLRDLRRVMSGPSYARFLAGAAEQAGAIIHTEMTVTHWSPSHVEVTSPQGRLHVRPRATILATGARERPRSARLIPGDRPHGVYTTGQLQNVVHLHHGKVGHRAVVVGAELVSWSAVLTLRHAGCSVELMTTPYSSPESYAVFNVAGRALLRVPVATRTRVTRVIGRGRLQAVEIEHLDTKERTTIHCDTLVLTGDWIPDHELARDRGLEIDAATRGPLVDSALRASLPGTFAIGNLVHPVDTADVAALDGAHVASHVLRWLEGRSLRPAPVRIVAAEPLRWVAPGLFRPGDVAPPRGRLLAWTDSLVHRPHIALRQQGKVVASRRLMWPASPGRVFRIPSGLLEGVTAECGDASIGFL